LRATQVQIFLACRSAARATRLRVSDCWMAFSAVASVARSAHQQMHVLGHHNVSVDEEAVIDSRCFQGCLEHLGRSSSEQKRLTPIASEGHEVEATGLLVRFQSPRRERRIIEFVMGHRDGGNLSVCAEVRNTPAQASLEQGTLKTILLKEAGYLGHPLRRDP